MAAASSIIAAAAIATTVASGVAAYASSEADRNKAMEATQSAYDEIRRINAPPELAKQIIVEKLKSVGVYKPEMEQAIDQGATEFTKIQEDPSLRDAQTSALQTLQQRGRTGLGPEDRAAYNELRRKVEQQAQSRRAAILQQMAARGMGGSGAELASQLSASQASDQDASASADRLSAEASQRALQAMTNAGQLAGNIRSQDYQVASDKAKAIDELNRFNVQNQIARTQRNVSANNEAQLRNLMERQRIADNNVQLKNNEMMARVQQAGSDWDRKMALTQAKANAKLGQANQYQQQANQTAGMIQGIGSGVSQGLGALSGYYGNKQTAADNALERQKDRDLMQSLLRSKNDPYVDDYE